MYFYRNHIIIIHCIKKLPQYLDKYEWRLPICSQKLQLICNIIVKQTFKFKPLTKGLLYQYHQNNCLNVSITMACIYYKILLGKGLIYCCGSCYVLILLWVVAVCKKNEKQQLSKATVNISISIFVTSVTRYGVVFV